jgi:hypothetical protein
MRYTVYRIIVCSRTKIIMISSLRNFSVRILDADRFTIVVFQILDIKSNYLPGIVHDIPAPLGKPIHMNMVCDASHASDLVMRHSTTGFFIYLCGTPVVWYSKHHSTVESSTLGSEFVALRIASEKVEALCTKLHQFGVPLDRSCNTFVENKSVVTQSTKPESTLTKKHNRIDYDKVSESIAMGMQHVCFEKGCDNQADCLTKPLHPYKLKQCMSKCLYWDYYGHKICLKMKPFAHIFWGG